MRLPKTITVDGPAGSGKSSVSYTVAKELGYLFVDTGAFYRAVTLAIIQADALNADDPALVMIARQARLDLTNDPHPDLRQYTILLDSQDVTHAVRHPQVETHVSRVSAISGVRDALNTRYRELAARGPVLMVGRDIGTVVLPDAELKIYLDASATDRARRRYDQRLAAGQSANYEEILAALSARDALDSTRDVAPLRPAPDAIYLNTDKLDIQATVDRIKQLIRDWRPH